MESGRGESGEKRVDRKRDGIEYTFSLDFKSDV